jgi:hypothetical protein
LLEQVRTIALVVSLGLIIVFIIRGCVFCVQAFPSDRAGKWITIAEILSAVAWGLIGIDAILASIKWIPLEAIGTVFWVVMACKITSSMIKSELGYKAVRDTYRRMRR